MFLPVFVCLSVCLSVCLWARLLKKASWIWMKCCMSTDVGTWTNWLTFEPDLDYSPDARTGLLSLIPYALQRGILLRRENPAYRYRAAETRGLEIVLFTASRRNNFVGGTVAVISIVLRVLGSWHIDGPEHDGNSGRRRLVESVYSHLSCVTWGPMCRHYPWTRELALAIFHDVIHNRLIAVGPMLCPY